MNKIYSLFLLAGASLVSNVAGAQCAAAVTVTGTQMLISGAGNGGTSGYAPGSVVQFCVTLGGTYSEGADPNYFHGVGINLGPNFTAITPVSTSIPSYGAAPIGVWVWRSPGPNATPPGYYFDADADGNAGNNDGVLDPVNLSGNVAMSGTVCFRATVAPGATGTSGVSVSITPDGLSGSYDGAACDADGTTVNAKTPAGFSNIALPVTYLFIDGNSTQSGVVIKWATSSEQNTAAFYIERSTDGKEWQTLGWVQAAGNHNTTKDYSYTDQTAKPGINLYRLAQTDADGKINYSHLVQVRHFNQMLQIGDVSKNPRTNELTARVFAQQTTDVTLSINDITGKIVYSKAITLGSGSNQISLQDANLTNGVYNLQIKNANYTIFQNQKFVY